MGRIFNKIQFILKSDMYRFAYSFGILLASFILSHARHTGGKSYLPSSSEADVCMTRSCVTAAADILKSLDETVDPCDDFYSFACGGWVKRHEASDEEPEINILISTQDDLDRKLRDLLESEYKSSDPPFVKMLKDFYKTCVDVDTIEKEGSETLKKMLNRLGGGWPVVEGSHWDESSFDWIDTLILFRKLGYDQGIMIQLLTIHLNYEDKKVETIWLASPDTKRLDNANLSLGLEDPNIAAYYRMMVKAAKLLGADESTAEEEMLEALHFEMTLKKIMYYDPDLPYEYMKNMHTIAELQKESPQVPWLKVINGLLLVHQFDENESFYGNFGYLVKLGKLVTSTDKRIIANYMLWRAVLESKKYLSEEWKNIEEGEEDDEFPTKKSKFEKKKPRWSECLTQLEKNMHIGLSSYYVRHYFNEESKDEAMMLMKYVYREFLKMLENNDWMDEITRKKAEDKANTIKAYIGYPKELLNDTFVMYIYENLTITNDSYLENTLAFKKMKTDWHLLGIKEGLNVRDMVFSSKFIRLLEASAFYSPFDNSIGIPAGILHDAFFDKDRPEYMNFAEIGYIIGHEITHGFDNDGRKFDKDGNQDSWWDKDSEEHYLKKVQCIIDQYDNYTTFVGIKVNGEKTQNENIADNGGLKEAYLAYQSWIKDHGTEPLLPAVNYTQNQLFWLSAAHVWCSQYTPERLKEFLVIDRHSPGKFRIIGPMSNLEEFSKDFKCSPDAPMNRKYKCEVW